MSAWRRSKRAPGTPTPSSSRVARANSVVPVAMAVDPARRRRRTAATTVAVSIVSLTQTHEHEHAHGTLYAAVYNTTRVSTLARRVLEQHQPGTAVVALLRVRRGAVRTHSTSARAQKRFSGD